MRESNLDTESETDENSVFNIHVDPMNILHSLSILSRIKSPHIKQAITLLLSGISIENAKSVDQATTRKRLAKRDEDSENRRTAKTRKICNKRRVSKLERKAIETGFPKCYICNKTFHNVYNLIRHLNNLNIHDYKYCPIVMRDGSTKYRCGLCGDISNTEEIANQHIQFHTKKAKRQRNSKDLEKVAHEKREKKINNSPVFLCLMCDVATTEIDHAVEHAQDHQVPNYDPCPRTCDTCELTFEELKFPGHISIHNSTNVFIIKYNPLNLLNDEWSQMLQSLDSTLVNKMKFTSIYRYTRKVKMDTDDEDPSKIPIYQCNMCETFVSPEEVEEHCYGEEACKNIAEYNLICDSCDIFFFTPEALTEHEKEEKAGKSFRIVTFNSVSDLPINKALRNLQANSQLLEDTPHREKASNSTEDPVIEPRQGNRNEKGNGIVILENRQVNVAQFCQECGVYIQFSDIQAHEATHRCNQVSEDEDNQSTDEEVAEEPNLSRDNNERDNSPDEILEAIEFINENAMNNNSISGSEILGEEITREDNEQQIIHFITATINQNTNEEGTLKQDNSKNISKGGTVSGSNTNHELHTHPQANMQMQKDELDKTVNTTVQTDISNSNINISTANQRIIIGLEGDQSFAAYEEELKQNIQVNVNKIFIGNISTEQSKDIVIDISDDEYYNDNELNYRTSTPSSSLDFNTIIKDEIIDDKSNMNLIYETDDIIDLTGEENEEHTTGSSAERTRMVQSDSDKRNTAEETFQTLLDDEQRIRELLSERD